MKNAFAVQKLVFAFAVMALADLLAAPAFSAQNSKNYTVSIIPEYVDGGSTLLYTLTIKNDESSGNSAHLGATTVAIPYGFTVDPDSLSASAAGSKDWTVSLSGDEIMLMPKWQTGEPTGDGNQRLDPGESLTLIFNATAPCDIDEYEWTTQIEQDTTFTGDTYFSLLGVQPVVSVIKSCADPAFSWYAGDYCTYTQGGWGSAAHGGNVGSIRNANFSSIYGSGVIVGDDHWMEFTASSNVENYLPAGGTAGSLTGDLTNPTSTSSGVFGGQVLSLRMNLDFNEGGFLDSFFSDFGSVVLSNTGTTYDGSTISEVLEAAEEALGGHGGDVSILNTLVTLINEAFDKCVPTQWAQEHLTPGE